MGKPGRETVKRYLPALLEQTKADFVVANAENAAGGAGLTPSVAQELFSFGIDVLTSGNHIFSKKEIMPFLEVEPRVIRPANYPQGVPGRGYVVHSAKNGLKVGVLNLMGRTFMPTLDCPFRTADTYLEKIQKETALIFVDFHAEATSEKQAVGWYLDGRVSAVVGSHTHVQTCDERILPGGTGYITDAGMVGPVDSVIGVKKEQAINRFLTSIHSHLDVANGNGPVWLCGVLLQLDNETGKTIHLSRIQQRWEA